MSEKTNLFGSIKKCLNESAAKKAMIKKQKIKRRNLVEKGEILDFNYSQYLKAKTYKDTLVLLNNTIELCEEEGRRLLLITLMQTGDSEYTETHIFNCKGNINLDVDFYAKVGILSYDLADGPTNKKFNLYDYDAIKLEVTEYRGAGERPADTNYCISFIFENYSKAKEKDFIRKVK